MRERYVVVPRQREFIDPTLTWFALWCRVNRDRQAAEALAKAGIAAYRPLEARRTTLRGKAAVVERSPVARYLFAGLARDQHFRVAKSDVLKLPKVIAGVKVPEFLRHPATIEDFLDSPLAGPCWLTLSPSLPQP